jgi:Raf kinase inhibitor-like YbhB/YbcL family protein
VNQGEIMSSLLRIFAGMLLFVAVSAFAAEEAETKMAITTTAFLDEGIFPVLYTCDGKDISPQLDWTNVPAKTQTFALLMVDPGAPGGTFYHWILYNIPKSTASLPESLSKLPAGALAGTNSMKKAQYNGPCPPKGSMHTYIFTLYALDTKLNLPAGADGKKVLEAMQKHIVGETKLTGVYSRWLQ